MNPKEHSFRRRILAQALSDTSIKLMDEAILANVRKFCDAMVDGQHTKATVEWSSPKNMAKWTDYLTFDIMGSVCFSHNFLLLTHERNRFLIEVLPATLNMVDIVS